MYEETELNEDIEFIAKKLGLSYKEFNEILNVPQQFHKNFANSKKFRNILNRLKKFILKFLKNNSYVNMIAILNYGLGT